MTPVQEYQKTLKAAGFYRGFIDGEFGPLTLAGAMSFHGNPPAWLFVAAQELGVSEILGNRHNPRIVEYHQATNLKASADEVAWCASFVNWCLLRGGSRGTNSAAARSFDSWGFATAIRIGAVMTIPTSTGSRRHVAFVAGFTASHVFHLGGNQSNRVNVQTHSREAVTAMRWPKP